MNVEFYADQYRRYATYARNYPGTVLKKVVSGANSTDYNWTEVLMKKIPANEMWGVSLHYYTLPTGDWGKKGPATGFAEKQYFSALKNALFMDELVKRHSDVMDKYDPSKKVALAVDEWGIWTDVEPGTNPGFLYQQNSLRDALIAASTLNIFNKHAERVKLASLAQTVNVLQALILTEKEKMLLTPTYHVFDLFQVHQDAKLLPITLNSPDYVLEGQKIPALNVSASQDASGKIHISLVNIDPTKKITISTDLKSTWKTVTGKILTSGKYTDINTFDKPNNIQIANFAGASKKGGKLVVDIPAKSVVVLELK